jgi:hypothetical protein
MRLNGEVTKYKAMLVARGFLLKPSLDLQLVESDPQKLARKR